MMGSSGGSDPMSCEDVGLLLEKKVAEEPLSDAEQQAVEQHLTRCGQCRDFVQLTSSLPRFADPLSNNELDSAVRAVMGRAESGRKSERAGKTKWTVFAIAASIAAVVLVGVSVMSRLSREPLPASASLHCAPAPPTELVPGVFLTYCDDREPGSLIENGGEVRVSLRNGTVGLFIDPERRNKRKVTVETPLAEVRVKGTVFSVHVDQEDARVEVFRGVVEIVPTAREADAFRVEADHGADVRSGTTFRLSDPKTDTLREALVAMVADEAADGTPAVGVISDEAPDTDNPAGTNKVRGRVEPGKRRGADGAPRRSAVSLDSLIQNAQSCLIDRDWSGAASQYREVLKRYSGRPEAIAALISLAKIELRHLGAPNKALAHYKLYQQRAPNGPLAEEALFGIAGAYRRLGMEEREKETLRLFVRRYPSSSLLGKARARRKQLGDVASP